MDQTGRNSKNRKRARRQDRIWGPRIEPGGGNRESFLQALVGGDSIERRKIFRQLFDEWCDTGLIAQREERPHTRNIWKADDAIRICHQFCCDHPPSFRLGNGGHRYSRPVANNEEMLGAFVSGDFDPEASRLCGIMDFIDFLDKQYCFEFAKCRECGRYFDMGRKPKEVYPNGIHCPRHECQRAQASKAALVATQKARVLEKVERLALAAKALANWQEPAVNPDSDEIFRKAMRENRRRVSDLGLSANWITRHRSEIDKYARQIREGMTRGALQAR